VCPELRLWWSLRFMRLLGIDTEGQENPACVTYRLSHPLLLQAATEACRSATHKDSRPQAHVRHALGVQANTPEGCAGDTGALHHHPDDGHLLSRAAGHAGSSRFGHGGRAVVTGEAQFRELLQASSATARGGKTCLPHMKRHASRVTTTRPYQIDSRYG
jgi:hypothetical protein